jgi:hypothetical protein
MFKNLKIDTIFILAILIIYPILLLTGITKILHISIPVILICILLMFATSDYTLVFNDDVKIITPLSLFNISLCFYFIQKESNLLSIKHNTDSLWHLNSLMFTMSIMVFLTSFYIFEYLKNKDKIKNG